MNSIIDAALEECRAHNLTLEQSPEFQKIIEEVDKEVLTLFTLDRIRDEEHYLVEYGDYEEPEFDDEFGAPTEYDIYLRKKSNRIKEAKRLFEMYPDKPEHAARLFIQLGSCHWIWAMKKRILKEKYGITWYTPAELNPDVIFD